MKKLFPILAAVVLLLAGCDSGEHFISDSAYRNTVRKTLNRRLTDHDGALRPFLEVDYKAGTVTCNNGYVNDDKITTVEREALEFLYAYMPLADVTDYPTDYYLQNIRAAFQAREEMEWGPKIPEIIFRHFVLPIRVNNENLDTARVAFFRELQPRVEGLSMTDAILEVNHWCHEKVSYQPSDARTSSPLNTLRNALGRCGEESTFTVAALRSVGIPARQVYTPRWAHTDDNHAWVEAWADGQWHFLGACEPEAVLDLGWFNAPASRGMLMHTKVFGHYEGPEEVMLEGPNFTEVNLIDNYARTARADLQVVDAAGGPVEGACVDFMIYNYAEFYPAVKKYTDAQGRTFLTAGKGDMLAWASKDGKYGFSRIRFGADENVTITLTDQPSFDPQAIDIVPPPEHYNLPDQTEEQKAENLRRFAQEDSLRHAYEATFATQDAMMAQGYGRFEALAIERSRGNWRTVKAFLDGASDRERAMALLESLSWKDLHDVTMENLMDSYNARQAILGPRVANEFLTPYKAFFSKALTADQKKQLKDPQALIAWTRDQVTVLDDPTAWQIPQSPAGVFKSRIAFGNSRDVFFVSLARTLGIDARIDPVTGKVQYRSGEAWTDVDFEAASQAVAPQGTLVLNYTPDKVVADPQYYSHFTISKIVDGRTSLLSYDEGQVDMGGGVGWANVFRAGTKLDAGTYILVSGNRISDGSVPVQTQIFTIEEGKTTTLDLVLREAPDAVTVIGTFPNTLVPDLGRGFYVTGVLEVGKEPTNHALRDIAKVKETFEQWGRPVVLFCTDQAKLDRLNKEIAEGRYGQLPSNMRFAVDEGGRVLDTLVADLDLKAGTLPVFIIGDTFDKVYFASQGYTIGLGEQIQGVLGKL
ncbi:MAG: transglutaminase domain-containing protein [Bacteroidales bacterium]|nr:transglutaminase domain-containing protein [Bacteroidales bacterium]